MKKFLEEFKSFALRGNVLDLAVGVIIGGAFQSIVSSLTNDIISPILGIAGKMDFTQFIFTIFKLILFFSSQNTYYFYLISLLIIQWIVTSKSETRDGLIFILWFPCTLHSLDPAHFFGFSLCHYSMPLS